jgi:uncharacterized membrane protein
MIYRSIIGKIFIRRKHSMEKIRGNVICEDCGTIGTSKTKFAGSFWVEFLLYIIGFIFAFPTLFISLVVPIGYSIYRLINYKKVCRECGGKVIGINTPRGQKLLEQMGFEEIKK